MKIDLHSASLKGQTTPLKIAALKSTTVKKPLYILLLIGLTSTFIEKNACSTKIAGYDIVKNSIYSFKIKDKACFFAFYIPNPDPIIDAQGTGNAGNTLWYGYYHINKPNKIYEFPKPPDMEWSSICTISAVSFYDMDGDTIPDVTIIGTCDKQNAVNYTFPLVFIRRGEKYILDMDSYRKLYGLIALSIPDIRAYIAAPKTYHQFLKDRYELNK